MNKESIQNQPILIDRILQELLGIPNSAPIAVNHSLLSLHINRKHQHR